MHRGELRTNSELDSTRSASSQTERFADAMSISRILTMLEETRDTLREVRKRRRRRMLQERCAIRNLTRPRVADTKIDKGARPSTAITSDLSSRRRRLQPAASHPNLTLGRKISSSHTLVFASLSPPSCHHALINSTLVASESGMRSPRLGIVFESLTQMLARTMALSAPLCDMLA